MASDAPALSLPEAAVVQLDGLAEQPPAGAEARDVAAAVPAAGVAQHGVLQPEAAAGQPALAPEGAGQVVVGLGEAPHPVAGRQDHRDRRAAAVGHPEVVRHAGAASAVRRGRLRLAPGPLRAVRLAPGIRSSPFAAPTARSSQAAGDEG